MVKRYILVVGLTKMLQYTRIKNMINHIKVLSTKVLGTFLFFSLAFICVGCESNSMESVEQFADDGIEKPISTSKNVKVILSDSGNVKITMRAPVVERFTHNDEEPHDLLSEGMDVDFLDSLGNVEANVTCEHAIHYPKKNILVLTKNVQVYNLSLIHI